MSGYEARAWVAIARHDEDTAVLILQSGGHPDMGVYHVHQATEKRYWQGCPGTAPRGYPRIKVIDIDDKLSQLVPAVF